MFSKIQITRSRSSGGVIELPWAFWKALYLYFTRANFYSDPITHEKTAAVKANDPPLVTGGQITVFILSKKKIFFRQLQRHRSRSSDGIWEQTWYLGVTTQLGDWIGSIFRKFRKLFPRQCHAYNFFPLFS